MYLCLFPDVSENYCAVEWPTFLTISIIFVTAISLGEYFLMIAGTVDCVVLNS